MIASKPICLLRLPGEQKFYAKLRPFCASISVMMRRGPYAVRHYAKTRLVRGPHRRTHAAGGGRWVPLRLDFRFPYSLEGAVSAAHADGHQHAPDAAGYLCYQPG